MGGGRAWERRRRRMQRVGKAPTVEVEGSARAERTENIHPMSVTLDVSQLDMSALKLFMPEKSQFMLVIAETPQLEMGPYVAVAEAASAL